MVSDTLNYEVRDNTCWIVFNRPQAMNAFNGELYIALLSALQAALDDPQVRVAVLSGEGGRAFSAGADLKELSHYDEIGVNADAAPGTGMGGTEVFVQLARFGKPLIAAIDGHCLAGGMEVAALCDIRVATEQSTFGLPEARLSLMPDPGLVELGRLMPLGEALRLQLTGRPMTARRAYDIGYIQALVPDRAALFAEVDQIAADIALGAPLAVEAFKKVVKVGRDMPAEQASQLRAVLWDRIQKTEDRVEGPRAFTEKRLPRWTRK